MSVVAAALSGSALADALPALAALRIEVFRTFPYLYDGDFDYERSYLETFARSRDAVIVAATDGGRIVGCATGSALDTNHAELAAPLRAAGLDVASIFYCGESVLAQPYRGQGLGHVFFDLREAHARARGYASICFCAVVRSADHPLRPADYSPLDAFWERRGYAKQPGLIAHFAWKEIGEATESPKPMHFWMRAL